MRVAILTVSDAGARGERVDTSGAAAEQWAIARGYDITARTLVADEMLHIGGQLSAWCDGDIADLVLTTGGTGLSARDVTPEATRAVIERDAGGIAERLFLIGASFVVGTGLPRQSIARNALFSARLELGQWRAESKQARPSVQV